METFVKKPTPKYVIHKSSNGWLVEHIDFEGSAYWYVFLSWESVLNYLKTGKTNEV